MDTLVNILVVSTRDIPSPSLKMNLWSRLIRFYHTTAIISSQTKWVKFFSHSLQGKSWLASLTRTQWLWVHTGKNVNRFRPHTLWECLLIKAPAKAAFESGMGAKLIIQSKRWELFPWLFQPVAYCYPFFPFRDYIENCEINSILHFKALHVHESVKFPASLPLA